MFDTYREAVEWIHQIRTFGEKPGLKRMQWMLKRLGNPEKKLKAIHVAGTNGKGSTVTYLRNMLQESGQVVGTYTSPYIEVFNERISVDGMPISDEEILRLANRIYPLARELETTDLGGPSEFEVITAMMFLYFGEGHADVVVIEVGLGGLYDSTNVITPIVSVITTIGYDHMNILGQTLPEIALQKAGIIKPGVPVVTGNLPEEAFGPIEVKAEEMGSEVIAYNREFSLSHWQTLPTWGEQFTFEDRFFFLKRVQISMLGKHQAENAAVALEALRVFSHETGLSVSQEAMLKGLKNAFWPGRMEKVNDSPFIILDGAHNEPAVKRLAETIQQDFPEQTIFIMFAALNNKDSSSMLKVLNQLPNVRLIVTSFDYARAATANELEESVDFTVDKQELWQEALVKAVNEMDESDVLVITGSLYFISEVRNYFKEVASDED